MGDKSNPGAGFEHPPYPVVWNERDVLLFANSIGCTVDELHFLYELHPSFSTFPSYAVILPFKRTHTSVIDFYASQKAGPKIPGVPTLDSRRVLDGERHLIFHKTLPTTTEGKNFEVRTKVLGVWDKGKPGTVMDTQFDIVDKTTGETYVTAKGSAFFVGQGGWGGPKGPKAPSYAPPSDRDPDATFTQPTDLETAHLYRLNGDYNPLHATPEPGLAMKFGGAIMHGLYSWNSACHALLYTLGGSDPKNMKEFQARFASPVKPGDTLVIEMWRCGKLDGGFEEIRFVVKVKETGKVVLANGRSVMKVVGKQAIKDSKSKL